MTEDDADPDRPDRTLLDSLCAHRHPLLEPIHCQRLRGHPGKHAAAIEHTSAEFTLEWTGGDSTGDDEPDH